MGNGETSENKSYGDMEISPRDFQRKYEVGTKIGEGTYGEVFNLMLKNNPIPRYALKRIPLKEDKTTRDRMLREIECLVKLQHQNIVRLIEYSLYKKNTSFGPTGKIYHSIKYS